MLKLSHNRMSESIPCLHQGHAAVGEHTGSRYEDVLHDDYDYDYDSGLRLRLRLRLRYDYDYDSGLRLRLRLRYDYDYDKIRDYDMAEVTTQKHGKYLVLH